jgi:hypothetical protein
MKLALGLYLGSGGASTPPPTVAIAVPTAGAVADQRAAFTISGTSTNATSVDVYLGVTLLGTATGTDTWSYTGWTPTAAQAGAQTLTAKATGAGGTTTSAGVAIAVWSPLDEATIRHWRRSGNISGDGTNATLWTDSTPGAHNFGIASGGPLYGLKGGYQCLFSTVDTTYRLGALAGVTSAHIFAACSAVETFRVIQVVNSGVGFNNVSSVGWGTSASPDVTWYTNDHMYEGFGSSVRRDCGVAPVSMKSPCIEDIWSATNDFGVEINGVPLFSTATNTVAFGTGGLLTFGNATACFAGNIWDELIYGAKADATLSARTKAFLRSFYSGLAIP